jgi:preprotein translocase subunit SecF
MIEIFRDTKYDFLGKKWICFALSCAALLIGLGSVAWRALDADPKSRPFNMGVDFTGGTIVNAKFRQRPDPNKIRAAIEKQGIEASKIIIQPVGEQIGQTPKNEVLIRLPNLLQVERREGESETAAKATADADIGGRKIRAALESLNDPSVAQNKVDLNLINRDALKDELARLGPLNLSNGQSADARYGEIAARIISYREKDRGGLIGSLDEIKNLGDIEPQLGASLDHRFFAGTAAIKSTEAVSPQVGADLRNRAIYVTLLACAGMMLFVAYRFKSWGFGIGGVTAVFHTVLITLGLFSVMQWEMDMTVIAALLTLVGFQMNDMIVVFDRIREMSRVRRREPLKKLTNDAINETMSRTVITNGLAFLTVLALLLFGGDVLKSFSWALFIGVVIATYSTIYIASPVMLWWEATRGRKRSEASSASTAAAAIGGVSALGIATSTAGAPRKRSRKRGK